MDDAERTMQALHDAILDALFNGGVLPEETIERLLGDPADADQADARSKLEELIQQIIDRMTEEGYITAAPDLDAERERRQGAAAAAPMPRRRPSSKSPTRRSIFSATARCAICSGRSARAATAATTRASRRPASKRPARPSRTSSATRSISTPPARC